MRLSTEARFWDRIDMGDGGCWLWSGHITNDGYGTFWDGKRTARVHRWSYERYVGAIPDGLVIDHLCRVRHCANPDHMEPVTIRENVIRGTSADVQKSIAAQRTHCPHGHEFTPENTKEEPTRSGGTARRCRTCERAKYRRRYQRRKAARLIAGGTDTPKGEGDE